MRILLATIAVTFVNFFSCHCQPLCACVTVDMNTGTYSVDKSGCVSDR